MDLWQLWNNIVFAVRKPWSWKKFWSSRRKSNNQIFVDCFLSLRRVVGVHDFTNSLQEKVTKRKVLSDIAKTFESLARLSPVTIKLKHTMQLIWQTNVQWDEKLPLEIWKNYFEKKSMAAWVTQHCVESICSSRQTNPSSAVTCSLWRFRGSLRCFSLCRNWVWARQAECCPAHGYVECCTTENATYPSSYRLVCSTTWLTSVASVIKSVKIQTWWSRWNLRRQIQPSIWTAANCVARIQEKSHLVLNHVLTHKNPADPASRRIDPSKFNYLAPWSN